MKGFAQTFFTLQMAFILAASLQPSFASASDVCSVIFEHDQIGSSEFSRPSGDDENVWSALRQSQLLSMQGIEPNTNMQCGTACIINILQATTVKAGLKPLSDPQAKFSELMAAIDPANRGLSHRSVVLILRELLGDNLGSKVPQVTSKVLNIRANSYDLNSKKVERITKSDLIPNKKQIKIISTVQHTDDGQTLKHLQIVESFDGSELRLIEPANPYATIISKFSGTKIYGGFGPGGNYGGNAVPGFTYQKPGVRDYIDRFEVLGVITVDLSRGPTYFWNRLINKN